MEPEILSSNKRGFNRPEKYIVVRGDEVMLRLVGGPKVYDLITATAGEEGRALRACADQDRLLKAAEATAKEHGSEPELCEDNYGRQFITLGQLELRDREALTIDQASRFIEEIAQTLVAKYEQSSHVDYRNSEMQEIYDALATDDSGEDVYLNDGLWLSKSGEIRDVGR